MSQESDPPTFEGESRLDRVDPAELFLEEWQPGVIPDLARFLDRVGPLNSSELSAVLRVDLCERWPTAERWPAENYLSRFPQLQSDRDACLDLIYWEFLVREQNGETPSPHEFCQRFPEYTESLLAQLGFHAALETLPSQSGSHMSSKSFSNVLQADADSAVSLVGKKFGRYQVLSLLGCGGMGEVYLALDSQLGRELALKVMNFQREDRHGVERFQREARIMAALQHPHLCAIYDFGEIDGRAYLTMPRLLGETLAERLKRVGPLSQLLAARISSQIARALHVMHQAGVVHRDLKPSNIMIDNHDQPVVLDFGLAWRDVPEDPRITVEGALTGTIAYLAPERIGAESGAPSPVCDVYSLGAIL